MLLDAMVRLQLGLMLIITQKSSGNYQKINKKVNQNNYVYKVLVLSVTHEV